MSLAQLLPYPLDARRRRNAAGADPGGALFEKTEAENLPVCALDGLNAECRRQGIRLLHRAAGGWRVVGEVALDAPDMTAELAVLRRTATALDPSGLRTKLLLPNAQIKYLTAYIIFHADHFKYRFGIIIASQKF